MNVGAFGLPDSARTFPDSIPNNTGLNAAVWAATYLTVAGVFRAIFSILFGAGALLFTTRDSTQTAPVDTADLYYRRTLWLMAFGLIHAYLFLGWIDILFEYGLLGLFLYPLRKVRASRLALIGLFVLAAPLPLAVYGAVGRYQERAAAEKVAGLGEASDSVTSEDRLLASRWPDRVRESEIPPGAHRVEIEARRSGYWANFRDLSRRVVQLQSIRIYRDGFWDVGGMMLLGMALLKWKVVTGARSSRFYASMAVLGFGAGLAIKHQELRLMLSDNFDSFSVAAAGTTYHLSRLLMALGYVGLVLLLCRARRLQVMTHALASVGRMALTNYIMQTIVCTILFYGVGFALFGRLERWQLLYVVAGIWGFQLTASPLWLRWFRFGPLEWLWRSLTYGTLQPSRLAALPSEPRSPG